VKFRPRAALRRALTAVGVVTGILALATTQPESLAPLLVAPAALIVVGSSTNQGAQGVADFFGGRFKPANPDDIVTVPFSAGPAGITAAVQQHAGSPNVILSSGWGAAYGSVALSNMFDASDPALSQTLWVLDNNVVTPNGGFGTRYPLFSSLTGVPTQPTPTDTGVPVVSIAYEYDVNSNAPQYVLNPFAVANTLAAYFQRRLTQQNLELPVNDDGTPSCLGGASSCTVTVADGTADGIVAHLTRVGSVTFVTYETTDGLPLVAPLRWFGPAGNRLADVLEPALTALVNWGYPNNDPIADPNTVYPARLVPSLEENVRFIGQIIAGIGEGLSRLGAPARSSPAPSPNRSGTPAPTVAAVTESAAVTEPTEAQPVADPAPVAAADLDEPNTVATNVVRESANFSPNRPSRPAHESGLQESPVTPEVDETPAPSVEPVAPTSEAATEASPSTADPASATGAAAA
jgi:hypothetical protein